MKNVTEEQAKADQSDSELELKAEEDYREFLCREEYNGKECGFRVRVKTNVWSLSLHVFIRKLLTE